MSKWNSWETLGSVWAYIAVSWVFNEHVMPRIEEPLIRVLFAGLDLVVLCVVGIVCVGAVFASCKEIITTIREFREFRRTASRSATK